MESQLKMILKRGGGGLSEKTDVTVITFEPQE